VDSGGRTLALRLKEQGTRGETAHRLLDECLTEAGLGIASITAICVGVGPGSFTGIRVCAALAQGLAFAPRLPLYPFSSLAALGACAPVLPGEGASTLTAIAANAGRYYVRRRPEGREGGPGGNGDKRDGGSWEESLLSAEALLALGGPAVRLITSGTIPDRERLLSAFGSLERFEENADCGRIAALARGGVPVLDGVLRPNYLMASAAEEKRRADGPPPGPSAQVPGHGAGESGSAGDIRK
jgi:tRNA threonylcarbamoyl adenosine modification protein YeaZ